MTKSLRVVFFGTPQFAVPSFEGLLSHTEVEILAAVTQPDKRRGRGNQILASPVKQVAQSHQIPVWQPQRLKKDNETLVNLRSLQADAFVVVAYGQILSPEILEMPRWGCINSHASLLPKYRGAAPIQWALYRGETETGITTMLMDVGMDTGAILLKAKTAISLWDNAQDLAMRLAALSPERLIATLQQLAQGVLEPIPQNSDQATHAPLIQKSDYLLDWSRSALELHNQVRGFFPNSATSFRDTTLKILATAPLRGVDPSDLPTELQALAAELSQPSQGTGIPGEVIGIAKNLGPLVQAGDGVLLLRDVKLAGKRLQSGWDFSNGVHLRVGEVLGQDQSGSGAAAS